MRCIACYPGDVRYTDEEIASALGCLTETVLRKLVLGRTVWSEGEAP
jgi:hypothetical protein